MRDTFFGWLVVACSFLSSACAVEPSRSVPAVGQGGSSVAASDYPDDMGPEQACRVRCESASDCGGAPCVDGGCREASKPDTCGSDQQCIDAFGAAYLCGAIDGSKHCLLPCHNDGICSDNAYSGCVDSMDDGAGACGFAFRECDDDVDCGSLGYCREGRCACDVDSDCKDEDYACVSEVP